MSHANSGQNWNIRIANELFEMWQNSILGDNTNQNDVHDKIKHR
jgi:hypothetical protein